MAARERFGGDILGPLSDFLSTSREDADLAERLLGDWVHAVLVRNLDAIPAIQAWHAEHQPGALVLLPASPGPRFGDDRHPLADRVRAEGPAAAWVQAVLHGSEVLDSAGLVLRRATGAVFLRVPLPRVVRFAAAPSSAALVRMSRRQSGTSTPPRRRSPARWRASRPPKPRWPRR